MAAGNSPVPRLRSSSVSGQDRARVNARPRARRFRHPLRRRPRRRVIVRGSWRVRPARLHRRIRTVPHPRRLRRRQSEERTLQLSHPRRRRVRPLGWSSHDHWYLRVRHRLNRNPKRPKTVDEERRGRSLYPRARLVLYPPKREQG